jgi:hypothetical protein
MADLMVLRWVDWSVVCWAFEWVARRVDLRVEQRAVHSAWKRVENLAPHSADKTDARKAASKAAYWAVRKAS